MNIKVIKARKLVRINFQLTEQFENNREHKLNRVTKINIKILKYIKHALNIKAKKKFFCVEFT